MAVQLEKGGKVNLNKEGSLSRVIIGLGWKSGLANNEEVDLDASAFLLTSSGKVRADGDFVFYNNKFSLDGAVEGADDNREGGDGEGDNEEIQVNLENVAAPVTSIAFSASIHSGQTFGTVRDAYIRVVNADTQVEILRYDLTGDFSRNDAVVLGELQRSGGGWEFQATGEGLIGGLGAVARKFGVNV